MDGARFDQLTRGVGASLSRRLVLGVVVSGLVGWAARLPVGSPPAILAKTRKRRGNDLEVDGGRKRHGGRRGAAKGRRGKDSGRGKQHPTRGSRRHKGQPGKPKAAAAGEGEKKEEATA